jgi:hypothetical protein
VVSVPVEQSGLVQKISVPPGTSTVTFNYVAPGWREGQALAALGAVAFAGLIVADLVSRRRRPRRKRAGASEGVESNETGATSLAPA